MGRHLPISQIEKMRHSELVQSKLLGNGDAGFHTHVRLMPHGHFHSFNYYSLNAYCMPGTSLQHMWETLATDDNACNLQK